MNKRISSAERAKLWRNKMKEQGLLKTEIWAPAKASTFLKDNEKNIQAGAKILIQPGNMNLKSTTDEGVKMSEVSNWTIPSLSESLGQYFAENNPEIEAKVLQGVDDVIEVLFKDIEQTAVISIAGSQMFVSIIVCPLADVSNHALVERALLRMQKSILLSSVNITEINGEEHIELFGALSATSVLNSIVQEIDAIQSNYVDLVDWLLEQNDPNKGE